MFRITLTILMSLVLVACTKDASNPAAADAELFKQHVTYLASDELAGREPGTDGYKKAAAYVAEQLAALGVQPGGDDGSYYQQVTLRSGVRDKDSIAVTVTDQAGNKLDLVENVDYAVGASARNTDVDITAPITFVGYGLVIDAEQRDDYAGLDIEGKAVAILGNTPTHLQSEERAYYGAQKGREASEAGAIAYVGLSTPTTESMQPFAQLIERGYLDFPTMSWLNPDGSAFTRAPNLKGGVSLSLEGAQKIIKHSGQDWDAIIEASQTGKGTTPTFETGLTINIKGKTSVRDFKSPNVVGVVPGSDPTLQDEVVILTAHLDGLGVSPLDLEDKINNGALDNAAGIATMLEAARLLQAGKSPRRTVMFLAVTAEEQGLLGAQYFAKYPTIPLENIVANINLDMPVLTYDFTDVIVFGGARSTINQTIETAAASLNIEVSPDPFPEQGIFTRSDHYRFVEEGVPSVMLATGFANGGQSAFTTHLQTHYHTPSDDLNLPINWPAGAKFSDLNMKILQTIANQDERPVWNKGDFFGERFNGPMAD